ncbi:hypothetical protein [Tenacibaculum halocynthiae]|uniref:hypothetical protein n=1 Tax=Tenacibaculum halocynthiae TaxID=1254437 RepID=UPI003D65F764
MKYHFILGVLITLFSVTPCNSQQDFSFMKSGKAYNLMSKARKGSLTIQQYRDLGYFFLAEGSTEKGKRYLKNAKQKNRVKRDEYSYSQLKVKIDKLPLASLNLESKANHVEGNEIINQEKILYIKVKNKLYADYDTLLKQALPKYKSYFRHMLYNSSKQRRITKLIENNLDLLKAKTEFETKEQYKGRITNFLDLANKEYKKANVRIEKIEMPYDKSENACIKLKKKIRNSELDLKFIDKYSPKVKNYAESNITEILYGAEQQRFKIKVKFSKEKKSYKYYTKTYTIDVPQKEAQQFKAQKQHHKYFFSLKDLRAIITGNKTYKINPVYTWYSKLICNSGMEAPILLINGKEDTMNIGKYIQSIFSEHTDFIKKAKKLSKSYLNRESKKNIKTTISIDFDKNGKYKNLTVKYHTDMTLSKIGVDEQQSPKNDFRYAMMDILETKNIKIIPRKNKCEPLKTTISFNFILK